MGPRASPARPSFPLSYSLATSQPSVLYACLCLGPTLLFPTHRGDLTPDEVVSLVSQGLQEGSGTPA